MIAPNKLQKIASTFGSLTIEPNRVCIGPTTCIPYNNPSELEKAIQSYYIRATNKITEQQELLLVYEVLIDAAITVNTDPELTQFVESANKDLIEFQENYPEICAEYAFQLKLNS